MTEEYNKTPGFIKLPRDLFLFPVWKCSPTAIKLYLALLLKVNWGDARQIGALNLQKGQGLFSYRYIQDLIDVGPARVRSLLKELEEANAIQKTITKYGTEITVVDYEELYQADDQKRSLGVSKMIGGVIINDRSALSLSEQYKEREVYVDVSKTNTNTHKNTNTNTEGDLKNKNLIKRLTLKSPNKKNKNEPDTNN
jgi:hypothetical protein